MPIIMAAHYIITTWPHTTNYTLNYSLNTPPGTLQIYHATQLTLHTTNTHYLRLTLYTPKAMYETFYTHLTLEYIL